MNQPTNRVAAAAGAPSTILFIDAAVADARQLAAGAADGVLVVLLDPARDGVLQIAEVLQGHQGLASVQVISHGAAGQVALGSAVLDAASLASYGDALATWGAALAAGGDLLFYGCDVGAGDSGAALVDALAVASGADVAASTDITGSSALGANWLLERSSGSIEAASALSAAAEEAYGHTLALANGGNNGTLTFDTASQVTLLNATGLAAGAVASASNILGLGLDVYAQSSNGGSIKVTNDPAVSVIGIGLVSAHLSVNGSLLSPASYVDLRANSGVFDMLSVKVGSSNLVGNLVGNVVFTVYALDANYQPTGVGVSVVGLVVNEYGLLNFASMANFTGIYGIRITNPLGFEIDIDDLSIANARPVPAISSSAYNAGTGVLTVSAVGLVAGDNIDTSKLSFTGQNGASYTLTSAAVTASSSTAFSVTLNAADKLAINGLLNNNGGSAVSGTAYNLSAAANWDSSSRALADTSGNPVTVSNVVLPTASSATYDALTHTLTVTGANLVATVGANNDITASKLTFQGEGGATRTLSTSSNVEITSATSFTLTLGGADIAAVEALMTKNGTSAASGTAYNLALGDDWNSVVGGTNIAIATVNLAVSNAGNLAPVITGAAAGAVGDNGALAPFANVSVTDANADNVSMAITYTGANGSLSGAGLSGSAGNYTLTAATPAQLTASLHGLVFSPTANQVAPGATVATTFTLTATDANGLAGTPNTATVVTATSVNDAASIGGAVANQGAAAGSFISPFASMTVADPDVGAMVTVTVTPDNVLKGAFTAASLTASGFSTSNAGITYTHTAATPAAAQAALQALVFQPNALLNTTTTFTVSVNDGTVTTNNSSTTVVAATPSLTTITSVTFSNDSGISATDLATNVAAQTVSGTLSGLLLSGETVEVSLNNGVTWTTATAAAGSNSWLLANQTLTASDTLQVRVHNAAGNGTALVQAYVFDTVAPSAAASTVVFSNDSGSSGDLVTNVALQTLSGSLGASLAAGDRVEVSLNNGASWTTASAATGSSSWSLANQLLTNSGTVQVRVTDAAGNSSSALARAYVLDAVGPAASITSNVSLLKSGETATLSITFSEAPVGFTAADLVVSGGTLGPLTATANPLVYTIGFTPAAGLSGVLGGVSLTAGSYTDLAGNLGGGALGAQININTLGPAVAISSDAATLKAGETANISFTFNVLPVGFTAADISVSGGTLSAPVATLNPLVYTALFTPNANVAAGNASITVTGGSYSDVVGNLGGAGSSPVISYDTKAPTLAITSSLASLHTGDVATLTFTFSEAPLGFAPSDIVATGGTVSAFAATANPLVYTALYTPDAGIAGISATVGVTAGAYTDAAGNPGGGAVSPSINVDTLPPTNTVASVVFSNDSGTPGDLVTNNAAQNLAGLLSANLLLGERVSVSLDNGTSWTYASAAVGTKAWTLNGQTLSASNTMLVRVDDAVGNHGSASPFAYVLDTAAPTLAISSDMASLRVGDSATLSFTFSEAPSGFTAADVAVSGGVISNLAVTGNPLVWTATLTPAPGLNGSNALVSVAAGSYTDLAGNGGGAASATPIPVYTQPPTLAISSSSASLKSGEAATITFTFSSAPTGFSQADLAVSGGTLGALTATANPLVYTALLTPAANSAAGSATVSVANGLYTDSVGNSGGGASSPAISYDTLVPSVVISSNVSALKIGESAIISFTFSEAPSGFTASDVSTGNGSLSNFGATADPKVFSAVFTPTPGTAGGSASIVVAAGSYLDAAGNAGTGAAIGAATLTIDTLAPTALANTLVFSADNGSSATDLVTNVAGQTISGTLSAALQPGDVVELSFDNGASWQAAGTAAGTAWSTGATLSNGSNPLQVRVSDAAGNHGTASNYTYVLDTAAPTATVTSSATALKTGDSATLTFTFSEAPVGFTATDVGVTNGVLSGFTATANPLVYSAVFTPTAGLASASAAITLAGPYTDAAGNNGSFGSVPVISIDTLAPTTGGAGVSFSADSGTPGDLITNVAAQTISGTLNASLVSGETVEVSLNNGLTWSSAVASTGSASWSLANQTLVGSNTLLVRVSDAAGNHGTPAPFAYALDTTAPTLAITSSSSALRSGESATLTFTFSEGPSDFTAADIGVTNGVLSGFTATANPLVYTAQFLPSQGGVGSASISVAAGSYQDLAGNSGQGASALPIGYATVAPGVVISSDHSTLGIGQTAVITFTFSAVPSGFDATDISVSNGTLGAFTATANPLVYTAAFTPTAGLASGAAGIGIAAGSYTDPSANPGTSGATPLIQIDTLAPSLVITSSAAAVGGGQTSTITFTFSEAPLGFVAGDVVATGGSLGNLAASANPLVYTATFTPDANTEAAASITVAGSTFTDLAGNIGADAPSPTLAVDTLAPLTTGASIVFSADNGIPGDLITNVGLQTISGTLSAPLAGGETVQVSIDNGQSWVNASASGSGWSLANQTLSGSGTVAVRVSDAAGNHGLPFALPFSIDAGLPTVTMQSNVSALTAGASALISFNFSKAPLGFDATDLVVTGGTLSGFAASGANPLLYTATFTPTAGFNGNAGITLASNLYTDVAGNNGAGTSLAGLSIDASVPTLAITSNAASLKAGESATILFTFSEAPVGFVPGAVSTGGGILGNFGATANPLVYSATFTPTAGQNAGSGTISVNAGSFFDAAGNAGLASSLAAPISIDTLGPSGTLSTGAIRFSSDLGASNSDLITNSTSQTISGKLDLGLVSGELVQVSLDNGITWSNASIATGGTDWTLAGQTLANGNGVVQVRLADGAGNLGPVQVANYLIDTLAPTVSMSSSAASLKAGETATITLTFSEAPTDFVVGDVLVTGGTLGPLTAGANPLVYTAVFTPTAGSNSPASLNLPAGSFTDLAGNLGGAAQIAAIAVHTVAPTLAISSSSAALKTGESALISFTFNAAPVGFAQDDVQVSGGTLSGFGPSANPLVYSATFTPTAGTAAGSAVISVASGSYLDAAGNLGAAGALAANALAIDTLAPVTTGTGISFSADNGLAGDLITNVALQTISGVLGTPLAGDETVEISLNNGQTWVAASSAGGTGWSLANQTLSGSGVLMVRVADAAGNTGLPFSQSYRIDTTAPTAQITSSAAALGAGASAVLTLTFSEAPLGLTAAALTATNGSIGGLTASANPLVYTAVFTPTAGTVGNASVSLNAGSFSDLAGNLSQATASTGFSLDTVAPALTISSNVASLKVGQTATISFTFSKVPLGFAANDVVTSGGVLSGLAATANPLVYSATFTPTTNLNGANASITVAAGTFLDSAGNPGLAATSPALFVDTRAPSLAIGSVSFSADTGVSATDLITSVAAQTISGTLAGNLVAGDHVEVSLDGGTTWATATGSVGSNAWSLAGQTLTGSNTLQVRLADNAGNLGPTLSKAYVLDTVAPTLAVTSNASALKAGETALITFTFSEVPHGFTAADLTVGGGTLGALLPSANPLVYTALFTPAAGSTAPATVSVANGAYTDAAGAAGVGASLAGLAVDTQAPTAVTGSVSFSNDSGLSNTDLVTNVAAQTISGLLGAPMVAGEIVQVSLDNGATWSTASSAAGIAGWSLAGITLAGAGTLKVRVQDTAGNNGPVFTKAYALDTSAPAVTLSAPAGTVLTGTARQITITLSEPGSVTLADLVATGGTLSGLSGSGSIYQVLFTPAANSTVAGTVNLAAGRFSDAAGNANTAANQLNLAVDTTGPAPVDPGTGAGTPSTVDGVTLMTETATDSVTGFRIARYSVQPVTATRAEDGSTPHATLADIPLGIAAAAGAPASALMVSLPQGTGLAAEGPIALLTQAQATLDLIGRIGADSTAGSSAQAYMDNAANQYLAGLASGTMVQSKTLTLSASAAPSQAILVSGDAATSAHTALLLDARALALGSVVQMSHIDFAALVGAVTVHNDAGGQTFLVGDDAAQKIVLSNSTENNKVMAGGGDNTIVSAAGNDWLEAGNGNNAIAGGAGNDTISVGSGDNVLQGGRTDLGQWQFYLNDDGQVVGRHQTAMIDGSSMETVGASELNMQISELGFAGASAASLQALSLFYHAAFERAPDLGGLSFWAQSGLGIEQFAQAFLAQAEARGDLAGLDNTAFVTKLYENSFGRSPDASGLTTWVAVLDAAPAGDAAARAEVFAAIALSTEHKGIWQTDQGVTLGGEMLSTEQGWIANSGDDRLVVGGGGNNWIVGGDGTDTVVYGANAASYSLSLSTGGNVMLGDGAGNHDVIRQIELGEFGGETIDLGFTQASQSDLQQVGMLYHLALGRTAELGGFKYWIDSGLHGDALATNFLQAPEFVAQFAALDNDALIARLYQNLDLGAPDTAALQGWESYLANHTRAELIGAMSQDVGLLDTQFGAGSMALVTALGENGA